MNKLSEETSYPIWIDEIHKIVSFKSVEEFERINFPSSVKRRAFVIEKCYLGYRIQ